MATFRVVLENRLGPDGEPSEFPADRVNANGVMLDAYGYVSRERREGERFVRDTWEYEIADEDADRFVEGLKTTPNLIACERVA